jgi:hypothetical protein
MNKKDEEAIVAVMRRLSDLAIKDERFVSSASSFRIIVRKMKKRKIPLTFYPALLMRACGDPRIWGAVEELTDAATGNQPGYVAGFIPKGNGSGNK